MQRVAIGAATASAGPRRGGVRLVWQQRRQRQLGPGKTPSTVTHGRDHRPEWRGLVLRDPGEPRREIAVDQINAAGGIKSLGGAKLAIKTFDTASNPDNGQTQATAAVGDKVTAVFGGEISDTVLAGINVTQRAGIPWVDAGGTANEIHERGYTTVFQADHDSTQFASSWLASPSSPPSKLGISNPTVAIAYSQSSYGESCSRRGTRPPRPPALKTVTSFGYPLTTTDFSSIAARLAASPADIILNMGYPADGLALAKLFATQSKPKQKIVMHGGLRRRRRHRSAGHPGQRRALWSATSRPA